MINLSFFRQCGVGLVQGKEASGGKSNRWDVCRDSIYNRESIANKRGKIDGTISHARKVTICRGNSLCLIGKVTVQSKTLL